MASDALPATAPATERGLGWHTLIFLVLFYVVAICHGASDALGLDGTGFLASLVEVVNLGLWAIEDARKRRRPIPMSSRPWLILFAGVAVPGYAIYTRGWSGLGWVILHAIGYFVSAIGSYIVAYALAYHSGW